MGVKKKSGTLPEGREKHKELAESLTEVVYSADPETFEATYVNKAVEAIYGYTVKEWLADPHLWEKTLHPDDMERVFALVEDAHKKGGNLPCEYRIIRKDGSVRWVEDRITWEKDEQGKAVSINGVMYDITERKRAEEELRAAIVKAKDERARSEAIIECIGDGVSIHDINFKILYQNQLLKDIFGDHVGEYCYRVYEGNDAVCEGCPVAMCFKDGKVHRSVRRVLIDNEVAYYENTASPLRDATEKIIGSIEIARDITERKRTETDLELFKNLIDQTNDSIAVIDPETSRFLDVNDKLCRNLGYKKEELLKLGVVDIEAVLPDNFSWKEHVKEVRKRGGLVLEGAHRRKDGTTFPVEVNVRYVSQGERGYMVGVARDITKRKKMEEALRRHAAELERSNAELEQFAYAASHDLQAPLRMVTGYLNLLARRYGDKLDKKADSFIGYAVEGTQRMQKLISDLLEYSKMGSQAKTLAPVDCERIISATTANLGAAIEEHRATVTHDPLPTVTADPLQLERLFMNLIGNAIKYRTDEPPRVHVSARQSPEGWLFSVSDNGIGMDPKHSERIFEVFQRLHASSAYSGTGIGLAIAKKVVENHGGNIWVESKPGKGSTFYFTIPAERADK